MRDRADIERIAIGLGLGDGLRPDIGAGSGAVLDHHLLAPGLGQAGGDDAGDDVGGAAGRERNDEANVPTGPGIRSTLRMTRMREAAGQRRCGGQAGETPTGDHERGPPRRSFASDQANDARPGWPGIVYQACMRLPPLARVSICWRKCYCSGLNSTTGPSICREVLLPDLAATLFRHPLRDRREVLVAGDRLFAQMFPAVE